MKTPYERAAAERNGDDEYHDLASSLSENPGMPIASVAVDGLMKQLRPWRYAVLPDARGKGVRTLIRPLSGDVDVLDLPIDETEVYGESRLSVLLQTRQLKAEDFLRMIDIERAIRNTSSTEMQMVEAARQAEIERRAEFEEREESKPKYEGLAKLFHEAKNHNKSDTSQPYTDRQAIILSQVTLHESRPEISKTLQTSDSMYSRTMLPLRKQFGLQDYYDEVLFGLSFGLADLEHVEAGVVARSDAVREKQKGYVTEYFDYQPNGLPRSNRYGTTSSIVRMAQRLGIGIHGLLIHAAKDGIVEVPDRSVYEEYAASKAAG